MTSQSVSSSSSVRQRKMNEFGSQGENVVESNFAMPQLSCTQLQIGVFTSTMSSMNGNKITTSFAQVTSKETSSYRECVQSLTYFHNKTVNIYSHLIPSSLVFWGFLYM
ncbi:hypothetical protein G9P44_005449 [Scheffersomyces stipitis]|nr:hypothetical protein G9P44_005449 [Scheffersomyces stipitis]